MNINQAENETEWSTPLQERHQSLAPLLGTEEQFSSLDNDNDDDDSGCLGLHPRKIYTQLIVTLKTNKSLLFWILGSIISNVAQTVYLKRAGQALCQFPYFLFWTTVIPFVLIFFTYLAIVELFTNQVTPEMRRVKQYKYMIIGTLTTLNGIFMLFANPHVPGLMQALLGPTIVTIPFTIIFTFVFLRKGISFLQGIAVLIILIGLGIAIYPSISGGDSSTGSIYWNIIFLLGSVPLSLAYVYEEKAFHDEPINMAHLLAWSTLYQMITIFLSFPLDAVPHFGTSSSFMDIFSNQREAFKCVAQESIECGCGCDCDNAWLWLLLFVVGYVFSSFFSLGVVKYGSATFSFIVSTLVTPLSEFAFSFRFLMGDQTETLSPYNYGSLAVLLIGVILFRVFDRSIEAKNTAELLEETTSLPNDEILSTTLSLSYGSGANTHLYRRKRKDLPESSPFYATIQVGAQQKQTSDAYTTFP